MKAIGVTERILRTDPPFSVRVIDAEPGHLNCELCGTHATERRAHNPPLNAIERANEHVAEQAEQTTSRTVPSVLMGKLLCITLCLFTLAQYHNHGPCIGFVEQRIDR